MDLYRTLRLGILACLGTAAAAGAQPAGAFITVPPIWEPAADSAALARVGAARTCEYLGQSGFPLESGNPDARGRVLASLGLGGLGLEQLDCVGLAAGLSAGDLTQRTKFDALQALVRSTVAPIAKLQAHCRAHAGEPACVALALSPPPLPPVASARIDGISQEEDDRDLDGSRRLETEEAQAGAGGRSPEARFVEGLTDFVLDRAKLEAIAYFEERFHTSLCEPDPGVKRVSYFPAVCDVLANARGAGFSLASASREMRAAARRDLRALPDNALHQQYVNPLPESAEERAYALKRQSLYAMSRVWLALAVRLRAHTLSSQEVFGALGSVNPDVCAGAAHADIIADCRKRLHAFALVGTLLELGMRVADERKLAKATLVDALLLRNESRAPRDAAAEAERAVKYAAKLIDALAALQGIRADVEALARQAKEAEARMRTAREAAGAARKAQLRQVAQRLSRFADGVIDVTETAARALRGCTDADCGLAGDELRRMVAESTQTVRAYSRLARNVMEDRWTVVAVEISQLYLRADAGRGTTLVGQYSPVIAELSGAQSSGEVQKILTEAAAPAGSYREKFRGNTRSITAFVGFGAGREYYRTSDTSGSWPVHGLFAPVGIHVTTPTRQSRVFGGAVGVYLSVLDLGPYASYRESASEVEKQPNVGLQQLVSPGAYLTYNISWGKRPGDWLYDWFNKSPWVFGIGVARTPSLLRTETDPTVTSTRWQAFFAIDVTLFPF